MSGAGRLAALHRLRALVVATGDVEMIAAMQWLLDAAPAAGPGQRKINTQIGVTARNAELRRAAEEHGLLAAELHKMLARYHAISWRRDRLASECPHAAPRIEARFWRALKAHDYPPGPKQLARILGHEPPLFMSNEVAHDQDSEGDHDDVQQAIHKRGQRRAS